MSEWIDKVWGQTREIISNDLYAKYELRLKSFTYCSLHFHRHRANRFILTEGAVDVYMLYGPAYTIVTLQTDNILSVPSMVPHLFVVRECGSMIEEYYPDRGGTVDKHDIVRIIGGGTLDSTDIIDILYRRSVALGQCQV